MRQKISPLKFFGNRGFMIKLDTDQQHCEDIYQLLSAFRYTYGKVPICFDLFSGSGSLAIAAMQADVAEKYVINDAFIGFKIFWQTVQLDHEALIANYKTLLCELQEQDDKANYFDQCQNKCQALFEGIESKKDQWLQFSSILSFIINHTQDGMLNFRHAEDKVYFNCIYQPGLIDDFSLFEKGICELHALFDNIDIVFSALPAKAFITELEKSKHNLVLLDPPYPSLSDARENPNNHLYFRTEITSDMTEQLEQLLKTCRQTETNYLMFYGLCGKEGAIAQPPICQENTWVHLSGGANNPYGKYTEYFYASENVSNIILTNEDLKHYFISWEEFDHRVVQRNYSESPGLFQQYLEKPLLRKVKPANSQELQCIEFQANPYVQDYVYEISVFYMMTAALQVAYELQIAQLFTAGSLTLQALRERFPQYETESLLLLIEFLQSLQFLKNNDGVLYPTPLMAALGEQQQHHVYKKFWQESYNIIHFLLLYPNQFQINDQVTYIIKEDAKGYCLSLAGTAKNLLAELMQGYILTRAIRLFTQFGLFDQIDQASKSGVSTIATSVDHLIQSYTQKYHQDKYLNQRLIFEREKLEPIIRKLLTLLSNYKLIAIQGESVALTPYGEVLTQSHSSRFSDIMKMIHKSWWQGAAFFAENFSKEGGNNNTSIFYNSSNKRTRRFNNGMSAISRQENISVAREIAHLASDADFNTIVDIGGGQAGLLLALWKLEPKKQYILFEKADPSYSQEEQAARMKENMTANGYSAEFIDALSIILGDFLSENAELTNIPTIDNALYCMKCCLHNYDEISSAKILTNIKHRMGQHSKLIIAERLVKDATLLQPHKTRVSNLLMIMLFKAKPHDNGFYTDILKKVEYEVSANQKDCDGYQLFLANPLNNELSLKK